MPQSDTDCCYLKKIPSDKITTKRFGVREFYKEFGDDVSTLFSEGSTLLHKAAEHGDDKVIEDVIFKGADVNAKNYYDQTPLYSAIFTKNKQVIRALINNKTNKADVNTKNWYGCTLLHFAVCMNDVSIVELLIFYGANKNARCQQHGTPLDLAKDLKYTEVIKYLESIGASSSKSTPSIAVPQ